MKARVMARLVDYGILYGTGILLSLVLPFDFSDKFYFGFGLGLPLVMVPLEAFCLSRYGTTPGKRLFGIRVEGLSFREALKRACFLSKDRGVRFVKQIQGWRYLVAVALALGCGSLLFLGKELSDAAVGYEHSCAKDGWVKYAPKDGSFSVDFPKKPKQESRIVDSMPLNEVKAKDEAVFSVSYLELPRKWRIFSAGTLLKAAMKIVLEHIPGAELLEKKQSKHKGFPSLDFRAKQGDKLIEGRIVLAGGTLYELSVTYPPDAKEEMHSAFLDSFDIEKKLN